LQCSIAKWRGTFGYANSKSLSKTGEKAVSGIVNNWIKRPKALGHKALGLVDKLVENVDNFPACGLFYVLM